MYFDGRKRTTPRCRGGMSASVELYNKLGSTVQQDGTYNNGRFLSDQETLLSPQADRTRLSLLGLGSPTIKNSAWDEQAAHFSSNHTAADSPKRGGERVQTPKSVPGRSSANDWILENRPSTGTCAARRRRATQSMDVRARPLALSKGGPPVGCFDLSGRELDHAEIAKTLSALPYSVYSINLSANGLALVPPLPRSVSILSLSHNLLESLADLEQHAHLVQVDISFNHLASLDGLFKSSHCLRTLNARGNELTSISGLETMTSLRHLDISDNRLGSLGSIRALSCNLGLVELRIAGNPITEKVSVRQVLMDLVPSLLVLDDLALSVSPQVGPVPKEWTYSMRHAARQNSPPTANPEERRARHQLSKTSLALGPAHRIALDETREMAGMRSALSTPTKAKNSGGRLHETSPTQTIRIQPPPKLAVRKQPMGSLERSTSTAKSRSRSSNSSSSSSSAAAAAKSKSSSALDTIATASQSPPMGGCTIAATTTTSSSAISRNEILKEMLVDHEEIYNVKFDNIWQEPAARKVVEQMGSQAFSGVTRRSLHSSGSKYAQENVREWLRDLTLSPQATYNGEAKMMDEVDDEITERLRLLIKRKRRSLDLLSASLRELG